MIKIFDRLLNYRYNRNLFKNMFKNPGMGYMEKKNLKILNRFSIVLLITFIVRFVARVYLLYFGDINMSSFMKNNLLGLIVLFLIYTIFSNHLLGLSYRDPKIKMYAKKHINTLFLILLYLLELVFSLLYFGSILYDYFTPSLIALLSIPVSLICYVCLFAVILDFCIYTTDNSDKLKTKAEETIDFL